MTSSGSASKFTPGHALAWTQQRILGPLSKGITGSAREIRVFADLQRVRWLLPYAIFESPSTGGSVSDLFLWRGDVAGTRFIAENTMALMTGEEIEVRHRLTFYQADGKLFRELDFLSSDPYTAIEPGDIGLELGTFIHSTFFDTSTLEAEKRHLLRLQRWHRGYCEYRRSEESIWSSLHGNFGGITSGADANDHRHRLLARPRVQFLYTPQYRFKSKQKATLYFLNPCQTKQSFEVFLNSKEKSGVQNMQIDTLLVPPLGVSKSSIDGKDGYITCRSRLPICRPILFVEEEGHKHHFDAFHT